MDECDQAYPSSLSLLIGSPSHFPRLAAIQVGRGRAVWTFTSDSLTNSSSIVTGLGSLEDCWHSVSFKHSPWLSEAERLKTIAVSGSKQSSVK